MKYTVRPQVEIPPLVVPETELRLLQTSDHHVSLQGRMGSGMWYTLFQFDGRGEVHSRSVYYWEKLGLSLHTELYDRG